MNDNDDGTIPFDGMTMNDIPAQRVLVSAMAADLGKMLVLGLDGDSQLYFNTNTTDLGKLILLLEAAKMQLLMGDL